MDKSKKNKRETMSIDRKDEKIGKIIDKRVNNSY